MKDRYLEVTFRKGRPLAAYLYLPRRSGAKSVRTERVAKGILVDYGESGDVIGLEITAPGAIAIEDINAVLERLGQAQLAPEEFSPLVAA
ncbi:MAG: DUF2283 domain-containing protein [Longimicrobiales bacterium]